MEVLSHSTPMIKQTIQTFPWKYYLIMPHDQTNNTNISMEILSHSTPMIKQFVSSWGYYEIISPWKCLYCLFDLHGSVCIACLIMGV